MDATISMYVVVLDDKNRKPWALGPDPSLDMESSNDNYDKLHFTHHLLWSRKPADIVT